VTVVTADGAKLSVLRVPASNQSAMALIGARHNGQVTPLERMKVESLGNERSIWRREERERKLKVIKLQAMEDCTFTPKTTKSFLSNRTATTNESSGGESVFSRLYRSGGCAAEIWSSPLMKCDSQKPSPNINMEQSDCNSRSPSTTSAMMSNRMEGSYQKHVQKMRARPLNEMDEKEIRDRNFEAKEMEECTFRPKTHWGRQQQLYKPEKRSTIVMEPTPARARACAKPSKRPQPAAITPVKSPRQKEPSVPKEIVVTTFEVSDIRLGLSEIHRHPWDSPPRMRDQESGINEPTPLAVLSPMREASLDSFEAIAARKTPQGKQSDKVFREIVHGLPPVPKKHTRRKRPTDYGSI
jgi:hypothetical protein